MEKTEIESRRKLCEQLKQERKRPRYTQDQMDKIFKEAQDFKSNTLLYVVFNLITGISLILSVWFNWVIEIGISYIVFHIFVLFLTYKSFKDSTSFQALEIDEILNRLEKKT